MVMTGPPQPTEAQDYRHANKLRTLTRGRASIDVTAYLATSKQIFAKMSGYRALGKIAPA